MDWTLLLAIYGSGVATVTAWLKLREYQRTRLREREAEETAVEVRFGEQWVGDDFAPYVEVLNRGLRRVWVRVVGAYVPDEGYGFDDRLAHELRSLDRDQSTDLHIPPGTFKSGQTIIGFAELTTDETLFTEPLRIEVPSSLESPTG